MSGRDLVVVGVGGSAAEHATARHSQQHTVPPRVEQGLQAGTAGTAAHLENHGAQAGRGGGPRDAGHSARNFQGGACAHVAVHVQRGLQGGWGGKQAGVSTAVVCDAGAFKCSINCKWHRRPFPRHAYSSSHPPSLPPSLLRCTHHAVRVLLLGGCDAGGGPKGVCAGGGVDMVAGEAARGGACQARAGGNDACGGGAAPLSQDLQGERQREGVGMR